MIIQPSIPNGRCVVGEFTTIGTSGRTGTVTIPYTGSGYPIALMVFVSGGGYNSANAAVYDLIQRYAVVEWSMSKAETNTTPSYGTDAGLTNNYGIVKGVFKNSASDATNYSRAGGQTANVYLNTNATNSVNTNIRIKANTTLSYYVSTTTYGLIPNTEYTYIAVYSS